MELWLSLAWLGLAWFGWVWLGLTWFGYVWVRWVENAECCEYSIDSCFIVLWVSIITMSIPCKRVILTVTLQDARRHLFRHLDAEKAGSDHMFRISELWCSRYRSDDNQTPSAINGEMWSTYTARTRKINVKCSVWCQFVKLLTHLYNSPIFRRMMLLALYMSSSRILLLGYFSFQLWDELLKLWASSLLFDFALRDPSGHLHHCFLRLKDSCALMYTSQARNRKTLISVESIYWAWWLYN